MGDYTFFLAGALARMGHPVEVLTGVGDVDESLYPLPPGVRVHRVVGRWDARGLADVIRLLRTLDPHVLLIQYLPHAFHERGIPLTVNLLPALVRALSGIRVVTNFHELYIPFDRSLKRDLGGLWQRGAAALVAFGSHILSVTAGEWQARLRRLGVRKRIHLIPVGSNIPRAPISDVVRARLRNRLLGGSGGTLLGVFGRWHDRDLPAVLYGLQRLKRTGPAKLIWIGGGSLDRQHRVSLEEVMRATKCDDSDVRCTGALPHPEVSKMLSVCDLMVLPFIDGVSTRRTSAVTALEHALPLLTTCGTRGEPWFLHGENVYLTPAGDRQALADGLVELARSPELRARLGEGARALYDVHFSWDVIAQQVAGLVEDGSSSR